MNRKICYLILFLVQVLGALFQVSMFLSGEPGNGESPYYLVVNHSDSFMACCGHYRSSLSV